MMTFQLSEKAHIGFVHLKVRGLEDSLMFYRDIVGFIETQRNGETAFLSATGSTPHQIILTEDKNAAQRSRRSPGLFHIAIRFPNRRELAGMFKRIDESRWQFHGFSDHGVSEALYLADADGNGIELYVDRPKDEWKFRNGTIEMTTKELDIDNLLHELPKEMPSRHVIHPQTDIGHIHLQISDLAKAEQFYCGMLGFDVTQRNYPGALFVSAGGYHHHIGLNIWNSGGSAPALKNALGLQRFGIHIPDRENLEQLQEKLTRSAYPFSENTLGGQDTRSIVVRDSDKIEIEIFSNE